MDREALLLTINELHRAVEAGLSPRGENVRPLIGVSANQKEGLSCINNTYIQSVADAGGAPVLIPVTTNLDALSAIVSQLDGLLLTGGGDINPLMWEEEPIPALQEGDPVRDTYDFMLLKLAADRCMPVFGICRGHQLINMAFGGSMYQDIRTQHPTETIKHSQQHDKAFASHTVTVEPNSLLGILTDNQDKIKVNSLHHQAVKEVAPGFKANATASDGVNEGMEAYPFYPLFSVQWHPETMAAAGDELMRELFRFHIEEATLYNLAKSIHRTILSIDSHCDTPQFFDEDFDIGRQGPSKVNLPLMEMGHIDAAFLVAYQAQGERDDQSLQEASDFAFRRFRQIREQVALQEQRVGVATNTDDLIRLKKEGKKAFFIAVENGYAMGKDLRNLERFKEEGVTYITLCHNGSNDLCDSAVGEPEWNGLSPLGKEAVKEMNRLGIMVDVSHASEATFYDVMKESSVPVIASHSSVRALCDHPRNLTDDQIRAIAAKGGVVQICLYNEFINPEPAKASIDDALEHIRYVADLVGVDYVGIGSDFDGGGELLGCRSSNELIQITVKLLGLGYTEPEIEKIWGGNLLRVMNAVQQAAGVDQLSNN